MKILYPLSLIYNCGVSLRALLYKYKILKSYDFNIPIISIGNITMGGTGKTPMTMWLFNELVKKSRKPCIISRGYNRQSKKLIVINKNYSNYTAKEVGDEPLMMINKIKNIQMVINNNKIKAIEAAMKNLDIDTIILDDGFQSRYINRSFDIVMINAKEKDNHYNLFPMGAAREPLENINRASALITNRGNINSDSDIYNICLDNNINIFPAQNIFSMVDENNKTIDNFENICGISVCGIADSASFLNTLNNYKIDISAQFIKQDHYDYKAKDLSKIYKSMEKNNCNTIITTWKDYYKIYPLNINNKKILILDMKLNFSDNTLLSMIDKAIDEK